jgi:hypothetical protein
VPLKTQLKITWPHAIAITLSGIITFLLLDYVSLLIIRPFLFN